MIQCGSFTDSSSGFTVDLGFEPQWLFTKRTDSTGNWEIVDVMRGFTADRGYDRLFPNLSNPEDATTKVGVNSTGFFSTTAMETNGATIIYMAIRRGPMATPTAASGVFNVISASSFDAYSVGFPTDLFLMNALGGSSLNTFVVDRMRGKTKYLVTSSNAAEGTDGGGAAEFDLQNSFDQGFTSASSVRYHWKRAPGYHDVVAYDGTGSAKTVNHNLGVVPEMIWIKDRDNASNWVVGTSFTGSQYTYAYLNLTQYGAGSAYGSTSEFSAQPTSTVFSVGSSNDTNKSIGKYIAYLFATLAGVSKVGSVSHSGSSTDVDCGFSSGSKFVLLKRADSSGDWYVWDSVRGIVSGNDPYLLLNTADAAVTNTDLIDPLSSGFTITDDFTDGTYIFYAIAT